MDLAKVYYNWYTIFSNVSIFIFSNVREKRKINKKSSETEKTYLREIIMCRNSVSLNLMAVDLSHQ